MLVCNFNVIEAMRMVNLVQKFEKYLLENLGVSVAIEKWRKEKILPLFLRDLYRFYECQLLHESCLVMEARDEEEITPLLSANIYSK